MNKPAKQALGPSITRQMKRKPKSPSKTSSLSEYNKRISDTKKTLENKTKAKAKK